MSADAPTSSSDAARLTEAIIVARAIRAAARAKVLNKANLVEDDPREVVISVGIYWEVRKALQSRTATFSKGRS